MIIAVLSFELHQKVADRYTAATLQEKASLNSSNHTGLLLQNKVAEKLRFEMLIK